MGGYSGQIYPMNACLNCEGTFVTSQSVCPYCESVNFRKSSRRRLATVMFQASSFDPLTHWLVCLLRRVSKELRKNRKGLR